VNTLLTKAEKKFMKAQRKLERLQLPFTYQKICDEVGWRSTQMAYRTQQNLVRKGYLGPSSRLVLEKKPTITPAGLEAMKRAA